MDNRKQHYFNFLLSSILAFKKKDKLLEQKKAKCFPKIEKASKSIIIQCEKYAIKEISVG